MFVDKVTVSVKAGDGGNGVVSFRHEKYVDKGGPDGGDGGRGGNVIFRASRNQNTLAAFRYSRLLKAEPGQAGSKRDRHGRNGSDLIVDVPVGTVVVVKDGEDMIDLVHDQQEALIAQGGSGGYGNAHFVSSTRQVPRVAEKGEPGQSFQLELELKMIADVGLVGLPNAGKSTLLSTISNAKPDIANYPFTTLIPHLGVVDVDGVALLVADIPGLIEGASAGKGLGDEFLRHVERTAVLLHLVDAYSEDIGSAYTTIQQELASYQVDLSKKPQIIVLSKIDGLDDEIIEDRVKLLKKLAPKTPIIAISSHSQEGILGLLRKTRQLVEKNRKSQVAEEVKDEIPVLRLTDTSDKWEVTKTADGFKVTGRKIERFATRTDFESVHGVARLRDIMRKMGIMHQLQRQGIQAGNIISIGDKGSIEY